MDSRLYQGTDAVKTFETQISAEKVIQEANKRFGETLEGRPKRLCGQRWPVQSSDSDRYRDARAGRDWTPLQIE